jgi:hypothetical protein
MLNLKKIIGVRNLFLNRENSGKIWGFWIFGYEFLFTTARTSCHYVCELTSSSDIWLCLCAHEYPAMLSRRKRTYAILLCQWECLDLRIQSSMVILLSSNHFRRLVFFLQPLVLRHVEALGYSSYWYPCPGYFELSIVSLFSWSCSRPFEK